MSVLNTCLIFILFYLTLVKADIYGDKVERHVSMVAGVITKLIVSHICLKFQLNLTINPGCPDTICGGTNKNLVTVVHITAKSKADCIHNVWSFVGKPSVLIAVSDLNSTLTIDWNRFYNDSDNVKSISIDPEPTAAFIVIVNKIIQFNDASDKGYLNSSALKDKDVVIYDPSRFQYVFNKSVAQDKFAQVKVTANKYKVNETDTINIGAVVYNLHTYGDKGHAWHFPHLLHNSNSSQMDLAFDKFKVKKAFTAPRLAVEYVLISQEDLAVNGTNFHFIRRKTLNDEHTPGIFELDTLLSPDTFVEYRPVSYSTVERDVSTSTGTHLGVLSAPNNTELVQSLAAAYFGNWSTLLSTATNISFGMKNDGYYTKTNYTTFTFQMGLGAPPTEELSKFIVIISLVGVGIPVLLLAIGCSCICLKRFKRYRQLQNVSIN